MTVPPPHNPATPRLATTRPWLFAIALVAALALPGVPLIAQTTQSIPTRPSVLAYGSADQYWIAEIQSFGGGSKPLHDLITNVQKSSNAKSDAITQV